MKVLFYCLLVGITHVAIQPLRALLKNADEPFKNQLTIQAQCKKDYQVSMLHLLMDSLSRLGRYNGVLLVADEGRVVFKKAYGYSKLGDGKPFTVDTEMQLASVSKPFTAVAVLMLIEQGALHFDDDVRLYLPELPYRGITIRHLLNHTSGLPDYLNRPRVFEKYFRKKEYLTNQDLLQILAKYRIPLEFQPGKKHHYCNTGYALLPLIVERVTARSFTDFMQENIFDKIGMKSTYLYSPMRHAKMLRENESRDGILGDKGIFSTVDDMFKWDRALYTDVLISQKTLQAAFERGITLGEQKFNYGYGWRIAETDFGEKIIYHKGFWQGANPMLIRIVDCNRTIISLHHANKVNSWYMVHAINRILNNSEARCANY
ncbi:MAG: serine hydrolase domain-containing protein [Cytophagales bacterium]|nr:beta-lactamase family protein [Bernardetiaceae bacterium]MDW8205150.1 serine hydrolase domain-containing protein [Cytophagales bacterium]